MAQIKISELTTLAQQLQSADYVPIIHSEVTYKFAPFNYLVKNSGDETIAGVKTFSSSPVVPTPDITDNSTKVASTAWVHTTIAPVSDISRLTDVSGDMLPDFPDDVSGRTYWQDNWATTDGWEVGNGTVSAANGYLTINKTNTAAYNVYVDKVLSVTAKEYRLKIKVLQDVNALYLNGRLSGVETTINITSGLKAGSVIFINGYNAGTFDTISILLSTVTNTQTGDLIAIDTIYIGTGAYLSPLHDKSGKVKWTDYGLIPVDGYRGKGLLAFGAQYAYNSGNPAMLLNGGTFMLSVTFNSFASQQPLCGWWQYRNAYFYVTSTQIVIGRLGTDFVYTSSFSTAIRYSIGITHDGAGNIKLYLNGVVVKSGATVLSLFTYFLARLASCNITNDATNIFLNGIIHSARADSRVWTDAECLSWHNDPRSVDSGSTNALAIDWSNVPIYADKATANSAGYYGAFRTSSGMTGWAG